MPNTFVTSDTHLSHQNIRDYTNRHEVCSSTEEMNQMLIDNWNSVVSPEDLVYHLGDVAMGKIAESLPMVGHLNGHKHLIIGNHDRVFPENKKNAEWFPKYAEFFEWIGIHKIIEIAGQEVELIHFPPKGSGDSQEHERYTDFRPENDGMWRLCGHVHSPEIMLTPRTIHVGLDARYESLGIPRYTPINIQVIEQIIRDGGVNV